MPASIGKRLKAEREARRLTLEKAAEATRIRVHYLQALENDDYSVMSSAAQGRGFLNLYADFLGLDLDAAMNEMRQADVPASLVSDSTPEAVPAPEPSASAPTPNPPRSGFWSRLLRRPASEPKQEEQPAAEATEPATAHEAGNEVDDQQVDVPSTSGLVESHPVSQEPVETPTRAMRSKSSVKKSAKPAGASAQGRTPGKTQPKSEARAAGKKKQSLSPNPKR